MLFVQQLVNGIALGAVYALFAVGFGVVFSTMRILNLAQGVYATWGALTAYWAVANLGLPFAVACLAGTAAGALAAVAVDQVAFQPLRSRGGEQLLGTIITSVALWISLREAASLATGAAPLGFPPGTVPDGLLQVGGVRVLTSQLIAIGCAVAVTAAIHLILHRTRLGSAIRAVGHDRGAAMLGGVDPRVAILTAAALAGAATGLAGVLYADNQTFTFALGDGLLLQGFAAVVIGGMGDVRGAALGGLLIGVVQVMSAQYISNSFQDAITFGLLLVVLVARPRGLFRTVELGRA
ncbi:branched-chain amino acid ABC transporter permease [Actinomadura madurae]|uniref:branched-chain amino acid ABC transporter permease n=1 Tax=Actinomadura madurae TaxID=1993 RepID=UPI002027450D|nr:branched-chain amino acid ABC transporter permease [Actinomadura madurae]MCP9967952.1 branched-chain amino acid ABC transporter permease [Actinomadura madurae]MCQ0008074.1 branched-chain amino acid ABC transporter permease [Actinomadura madurae]URM96699.1 branched-chain amino acid ABC transporter permease [Actinomadura madurae]URN07383.1 branched-chain amino acid ABC transporter permease [Actinomadura madurae]